MANFMLWTFYHNKKNVFKQKDIRSIFGKLLGEADGPGLKTTLGAARL